MDDLDRRLEARARGRSGGFRLSNEGPIRLIGLGDTEGSSASRGRRGRNMHPITL